MPPDICVAPMLDWTDRHCRYFHRLLSPNVRLYTEMVTTAAILRGDRNRLLGFDPAEHPVVLQLAGSDPKELAESASIADDFGYDEINLNCGCPSDRVQKGSFGACLMARPSLVAECVGKMRSATNLPVSVKCRTGIDDMDSLEFLESFISDVGSAGCRHFIIHARKAWLNGLSPKENRDVPPLEYGKAGAIKEKFPDFRVVINGGIDTIAKTKELLERFDGVMIGRAAYKNPWILAEMEKDIFRSGHISDRREVALAMIHYIERQQRECGTPVKSVTRHMLGLFQGQRGGRAWRRMLGTAFEENNAAKLIETALREVDIRL